MSTRRALGWLALTVGTVAAGFLAWTLTHRQALGLPWAHPRILTEATLAVAGTTGGLLLLRRTET